MKRHDASRIESGISASFAELVVAVFAGFAKGSECLGKLLSSPDSAIRIRFSAALAISSATAMKASRSVQISALARVFPVPVPSG